MASDRAIAAPMMVPSIQRFSRWVTCTLLYLWCDAALAAEDFRRSEKMCPTGQARYAKGGRLHAFLELRVVLPLVGIKMLAADQREALRRSLPHTAPRTARSA